MNNSRILTIKNTKLSGYYFYVNLNIWGDFHICISVPLILDFVSKSKFSSKDCFHNSNKASWLSKIFLKHFALMAHLVTQSLSSFWLTDLDDSSNSLSMFSTILLTSFLVWFNTQPTHIFHPQYSLHHQELYNLV